MFPNNDINYGDTNVRKFDNFNLVQALFGLKHGDQFVGHSVNGVTLSAT